MALVQHKMTHTPVISVILLGGTISKITNDHFDNSYFPALLAQSRLSTQHQLTIRTVDLFARDSTTFTDNEIVTISETILEEQKTSRAIIILMGTDGMINVTKKLNNLLKDQLTVPITVTGSIIPYRQGFTDALTNFGYALGVANTLGIIANGIPAGEMGNYIFICMNGMTLTPECAVKDYDKQVFFKKCPSSPPSTDTQQVQ